MADVYARWCAASGGLPAMLGARVLPLGHQIYAARRVLFDRTPRFILADEVGLGKTIEAGMIIQALQAERPDFSVLVVRSEERSVGKGCGSTCKSRWTPVH